MPDAPVFIPDFTLLRPIGRGAYGEVWLARSVTGVHRAVKIVRRDSFGDDRPFDREFDGLKRFEPVSVGQESQVGLLHVGRNEAEGFFYYVMELADDAATGEEVFPERYVPKTLKELRSRQRRLPARECLDIGLALTRALAHLHEHGLVHRDIKPSNVIFVHGVPKLADIGLVSTIDTSHSFVGTEGFVPPEGPGTVAADVFSLGKVLYEISTGCDRKDFPNLPEDLENVSDRRELLELNEIVLKACDADLKRRYATAEAMREDMLLVQAGRSVRRLHVMERRLRFIVEYGIAATIISALAIGGFLWASGQTRLANQNLERAERAEAEAQARLDEANFNWVRANRLTGRPGQRYDSLAELAKAAARTNSLALRNEAIAALLLPDLRPVKSWPKTPLWDSFNFSADFRVYGTNDALGNLFLYDTTTDELRHKLPTQGFPMSGAARSADGRFVATSDMFGQAWLWTLAMQQPRAIPFTLGAKLLVFTPDSRSLVVKTDEGALRFLNATNGAVEQTIEGFKKLGGIYLNSAGDKFTFVENENGQGMLHLHRRSDGTRLRSVTLDSGIRGFAWHPDGRHVAVSWSRSIGLWDMETGEQRGIFAGHESAVVGLAFNPTGDWLASASWDRTTRLWQTDTFRQVLSLNEYGEGLCVSADGRQLAYKGEDSHVHLHELPDLRTSRRFSVPVFFHTSQVLFSPDGSGLAVVDKTGVFLFQPPNPAPVAVLPVEDTDQAAFQPDGRAIYTGGTNGLQRWPLIREDSSRAWKVGSPETLAPTQGKDMKLFWLSGDGRWVVARPDSARYFTFQPRHPEQVIKADRSIEHGHFTWVSRDATKALSWSKRNLHQLQIWNPRTGNLLTNLAFPAELADALISPDERWLAVSTDEATTLVSTDDWQPRRRIVHDPVRNRHKLAFSPDSRTLVATKSDRELRLIAVETGETLAAIPTDRMLTSLTFNAAGDTLAATYEPGYFQLWNLRLLREQLSGLNLDWRTPPPVAAP